MYNILLNDTTFIANLFLASICGFGIRLSLTFAGQKWASTFHNTASYILLPVIAMVITKVISNNIALSLGMIGALSIVRFRNPVKNPFELVIFFLMVTLGVCLSVNPSYGYILTIFSILIIISFKVFLNILSKFGYNFNSFEFDEFQEGYIVEINSDKEIDNNLKDFSKYVIQKNVDKKNSPMSVFYRLNLSDKKEILKLENEIKDIKPIKTFNVAKL